MAIASAVNLTRAPERSLNKLLSEANAHVSDWLNVSSLRYSSQPNVGTVLSTGLTAAPARSDLHGKIKSTHKQAQTRR